MRIPKLPQVLFDEFPTDEESLICILTQPQYPVPDLSKYVGKVQLFAPLMHYFPMAGVEKSFAKVFRHPLPSLREWMIFNDSSIKGLTTPFAVACLPSSNAAKSVMLCIVILDNTKEMLLYTGQFREWHGVFFHDIFLKHRNQLTDVYVDNTMAASTHINQVQSMRACERIAAIVKLYGDYQLRLEMGAFDALDLLVELAIRLKVHIKLLPVQQLLFFETEHRHLFSYDEKLFPNQTGLNKEFKFKGHKRIHVVLHKAHDINKYNDYFEKEIIHMKLVPGQGYGNTNPVISLSSGLIHIIYSSHADANDLFGLFELCKPKRVHPIVSAACSENVVSKIPEDLLKDGCEIVNDIGAHLNNNNSMPEVTLNDIAAKKPRKRSFLSCSTRISSVSTTFGVHNNILTDQAQIDIGPFNSTEIEQHTSIRQSTQFEKDVSSGFITSDERKNSGL